MIRGKCPNCKEALGHVDTDAITVGNRIVGPKYRGHQLPLPDVFRITRRSHRPNSSKGRNRSRGFGWASREGEKKVIASGLSGSRFDRLCIFISP